MTLQAQTVNLAVLAGDPLYHSFRVTNTDGTPFDFTGYFASGRIVFSTGIYLVSQSLGTLIVNKDQSEITLFLPSSVTSGFTQEAATYSISLTDFRGGSVAISGSFTVTDKAYPIAGFTAWDDLRISGSSFKSTGGIKSPDFALFTNDGGSSHGIYLYWFDAATVEDVFFYIQMPHNWKEGSSVYPHVHFVPVSTGAGGAFVVWGLEYTISNIGSTFGQTTIIYTDASTAAKATVQGDAALASGKHYISTFGALSMTGKTASSMMLCRLFRAVANTYDTYAADAGVLEFDLHYEIDGFGSKAEYTR